MENELLQCYNTGCGQKFQPDQNNDDSCRHHPGEPFFHDAYKGWSCCSKKCTDFTEFLNIKGCSLSRHSNVKPPEPEKPIQPDNIPDEVVVVKPLVKPLQRPEYDSAMITLTPEIASSLQQQGTPNVIVPDSNKDGRDIALGTICKNGGCNASYQGPDTENSLCVHHPGVPIFHEGLKFWSCCQKRTTDFNAFLNQVGCEVGKHVWKKDDEDSMAVQCRWDFHQTGTHVIVSIYAKQYCPTTSIVKLNPIRLFVNLVFPQQSNAVFNLDLELCGVVDVNASQVSMYGTKVEIRLKKAEPGLWTRLEVLKPTGGVPVRSERSKVEKLAPRVEGVNLDDI